MKRLNKRLGGLIRIAEKKQAHGGEIDKIVGRQVERNLKMVRRIIAEEIIECRNCEFCWEFPDAIDEGHLSLQTASEMYAAGAECWCGLLKFGTTREGYCHMAARRP
jgi:hypothetical protein